MLLGVRINKDYVEQLKTNSMVHQIYVLIN